MSQHVNQAELYGVRVEIEKFVENKHNWLRDQLRFVLGEIEALRVNMEYLMTQPSGTDIMTLLGQVQGALTDVQSAEAAYKAAAEAAITAAANGSATEAQAHQQLSDASTGMTSVLAGLNNVATDLQTSAASFGAASGVGGTTTGVNASPNAAAPGIPGPADPGANPATGVDPSSATGTPTVTSGAGATGNEGPTGQTPGGQPNPVAPVDPNTGQPVAPDPNATGTSTDTSGSSSSSTDTSGSSSSSTDSSAPGAPTAPTDGSSSSGTSGS